MGFTAFLSEIWLFEIEKIKNMDEIRTIEGYAAEYLEQFIAFLPTLIGAILLLILGWWFIKLILNYVRKFFTYKDYDKTLEEFTLMILGGALKILLLIIVITQLGVETTSLVAIIGAAGLAIGLALQGSLSNFAGGVLIIVMKPFKLGDFIEAKGVSGTVKEISMFYTKLTTFGNQLAIIPNGAITNDNVINYTVEGIRRDKIGIGISYDSDIKLAKDILMNLLTEQENIFKEPAPVVVVDALADSSVNLSIRFWAKNEDFWDIHFYTIEESKKRLEAKGINIPFPQRDVHIIQNDKNKRRD